MILGFDAGIKTGWGVTDKGKLVAYGTINATGKKLDYVHKIQEVYQTYQPEMVVIEKCFLNRKKPQAGMSLGRKIETIIISILLVYKDALIVEVGNTTVKKEVAGNGRCKKNEVFRAVRDRFKLKGFKFKLHNDMTDAIALALTGEKIASGELII